MLMTIKPGAIGQGLRRRLSRRFNREADGASDDGDGVAESRQSSSKSAWAAGFAWAVSLSFILVAFVPFAWWHPYCDRMDDGPGYFGYGLPFPFRAFSGVSSLEYNFLPFVYLLDLVLMTALFLPRTIFVARKVEAMSRIGAYSLATVGTLLVVILVWINALAISSHWVIPSQTLDSVGDKYFSYRPWIVMRALGRHACDDYR
jgi:hypothetical protein